ncbi:hypothetical protein [Megalodesulfovibrio gigas]|uniref:Putative Sigma-70 region 4 type 2 n=1 Tax=Megalodesulfovibrio gigas (strain ATCC 19364 / DSM 1382 / NCIMB 9332 / VKM B-1759) TaxID=1121448 RepID=T2G9I8_MEGG1|nr:hypothetical protein [Megalodesulfovibrio gigas]AGW12791.1 putative Sigma-70 region 4 type 2 [Megalodesulfovibrio gigas DSM 1382 = ATCC 19364]
MMVGADGRSKLGQKRWMQLVSLFALDLDATAIARSMGCSRNTVNTHLQALRRSIAGYCRLHAPLLKRFELGDAFFQAGLVKGSARALRHEPPALWGQLPAGGGIVVDLIPEREADALRLIRHSRFWLETHCKGARCPHACRQELVVLDLSMLTAWSCGEPTSLARETPAQRMTRFLQFAMVRLEKFRGLQAHTLLLHLKETEFRFNHPGMTLYPALREVLEAETRDARPARNTRRA